jgi:ribosomal protein S18 acetylase RimI-like enzyme
LVTLSIRVDVANSGDVDAVVDLWRESGVLSAFNDPREDFEFALGGPTSAVLLATDASKVIVGSVMVGHDGHPGNIYYVAVAPQCRMRGIGRQLVQAAERWLKDAGVRKIHLLVLNDNLGVAPFYKKLGYGPAPARLFRKWLAVPRVAPSE